VKERAAIAGLILAGGRGRRLGGRDKALLQLAGQPLLAHVAARLGPQVAPLLVSANGDPARFAGFGLPVVPDQAADFAGPLAGLSAAMAYLGAHHPTVGHLLSVPTDCPFLPGDLAARLETCQRESGAGVVSARSGGRDHPTIALWSLTLHDAVREALARGQNGVMAFISRQPHASVAWGVAPHDPFLNINTAADLAEAERLCRLGCGL
jgi:molybdopterin-guanine dinucleotide biosynthesis protein A